MEPRPPVTARDDDTTRRLIRQAEEAGSIPHDSEIANVVVVGAITYGIMFNDTQKRFYDGQLIKLSKVLFKNEDYIVTANTVYKIIEDR